MTLGITTSLAANIAAVDPALIGRAVVLRQAARQRYLTTLADDLPRSGRELADMYGMSERWGRYQIRAARRTLTTHPPTDPPDSPANTTNYPDAFASQRSDSS